MARVLGRVGHHENVAAEPEYQPEDGDRLAHRHDGRDGDSYFTVGSGHGVGEPHFYVWLEEDGGERAWWLDPDDAVALGERLVAEGRACGGHRHGTDDDAPT
jgi:hypothetical protein